jgi:hypothetical protein
MMGADHALARRTEEEHGDSEMLTRKPGQALPKRENAALVVDPGEGGFPTGRPRAGHPMNLPPDHTRPRRRAQSPSVACVGPSAVCRPTGVGPWRWCAGPPDRASIRSTSAGDGTGALPSTAQRRAARRTTAPAGPQASGDARPCATPSGLRAARGRSRIDSPCERLRPRAPVGLTAPCRSSDTRCSAGAGRRRSGFRRESRDAAASPMPTTGHDHAPTGDKGRPRSTRCRQAPCRIGLACYPRSYQSPLVFVCLLAPSPLTHPLLESSPTRLRIVGAVTASAIL